MGGYGCSGAGGGLRWGWWSGLGEDTGWCLERGLWFGEPEEEPHVAERGGTGGNRGSATCDRHLRGLQSIFPVGLGLMRPPWPPAVPSSIPTQRGNQGILPGIAEYFFGL